MRNGISSHQSQMAYDDTSLRNDSIQDYSMIHLDAYGNIMSWNKGAEKIKGYSTEEIIGKNISVFYPIEAVKKGLPQENLNLAKTNGTYAVSGTMVRKDGTFFRGSMVITALYQDDKTLCGYVKITRDIKSNKELSDEIALIHNQAEDNIN